ncbi:MAG TPA: EthD family reductase [Bryobacteraceae bacterium]|nr:EthD family reductase [Bryobacteraceae bacterium]
MIRVTVSYPNQAGARFDIEYYMMKHMPLVAQRLNGRLAGWSVDRGVSGGAPGTQAEYLIQAAMIFHDIEAFQTAMAVEGAALIADVPNFTDLQPRIDVYKILAEEASARGTGA